MPIMITVEIFQYPTTKYKSIESFTVSGETMQDITDLREFIKSGINAYEDEKTIG